MRRMLSFANRTMKEILRDPLTMAFGLGFPVVLLLLLSLIQANIPVEMFELTHLTPGITVFGLSFMTLFSAQLISKDRTSSLLTRLYTTPLKATDFILEHSDRLRHFHIHDVTAKSNHVALGTGVLDVDRYLEMARKYDCPVVIEVKESSSLSSSLNYMKNHGFM